MYPPEKFDAIGGAPLVRYDAGRWLVFATRQTGTGPNDSENGSPRWGCTRAVTRTRRRDRARGTCLPPWHAQRLEWQQIAPCRRRAISGSYQAHKR